MEVTNCNDINGIGLDTIVFNTDGTVSGLIVVDSVDTKVRLGYDCCVANGYSFDPNDAKCYWSDSCLTGGDYKIVLNPEGSSGALFQVDDGQTGCYLEVKFNYLVKFDCEKVTSPLDVILGELKLQLSVEKMVYDENLPIPDNLVEVYSEDIFNITNILDFFSGNTNTGILLDGNNCEALSVNLKSSLGENSGIIDDYSLNSDWASYTMIIDDLDLLESINNERIKVVIKCNQLANFSLLLDNVELNRICDVITPPSFLDEECPKFDITRTIDNKKSWVSNDTLELRGFDLARRQTNYNINNEKLLINSKEVDLLINPSQAIESDILTFVSENPCILDPATGCTSGVTTHACVDINAIITTPVTELVKVNDLFNELIDVKNRKTISSYPTIALLLHRYRNSEEHCGVISNALNGESVSTFIDLLGTFWTELIEQVVPSTTIWGSSYSHGDNVFGSDKFPYKKSTLLLCNQINYSVPSPIEYSGTSPSISVSYQDITTSNSVNSDTCSNIYIRQLNYGSEFIGTITILGDGSTVTGSTISVTESIIDDCDKFETC